MVVGLNGGGAVAKEEVVETNEESIVGPRRNVSCRSGILGVVGEKPSAWGVKCGSLMQGPADILPTIRSNS